MTDSAVRTGPAGRVWYRWVLGGVGLLSLLAAATGICARFFGPVSTTVTLLATFSPFAVVLAVLSLVLLVAARWRVAAALAVAVVVVGVAAQLPRYLGDPAPVDVDRPKISVLQANIGLGLADADALVDRVRDSQVDVLTVAELTAGAVDRLAVAGIAELLPYTYLRPHRGGSGAGIYSRYPLAEPITLRGLEHNNLRATLHAPGAAAVAVYALHPVPPYPEPAWRWAGELDRITAVLADEQLPLIIGADFNSTFDHQRYRALVRDGATAEGELLDAADFLGAGIVATYPADRWYPPVLAIDRILTRGVTPLSFERVDVPGSDHHGVLAEVQLNPAEPG